MARRNSQSQEVAIAELSAKLEAIEAALENKTKHIDELFKRVSSLEGEVIKLGAHSSSDDSIKEKIESVDEGSRQGKIAYSILKWAGIVIGGTMLAAFVTWFISGAVTGKQSEKPGKAIYGPPAPAASAK